MLAGEHALRDSGGAERTAPRANNFDQNFDEDPWEPGGWRCRSARFRSRYAAGLADSGGRAGVLRAGLGPMSDPYTTARPRPGRIGAMTQILKRYDFLAAEFTRRVGGVAAEKWDAPSPCAGWSARDVLRHVIETHVAMPGYVGLRVELTGSVDDDPAAAWAEARDALREILADPDRAGLEYDGWFGRTRLEATVDRFLGFDLLVHAWDIARATGQDETLPGEEVARVHADALELGDSLRSAGVCGPEVEVGAAASAQDRLLAFLGRTP